MTPWLGLLVVAGVVLLGAAACLWALLAAASEADKELKRLMGEDD